MMCLDVNQFNMMWLDVNPFNMMHLDEGTNDVFFTGVNIQIETWIEGLTGRDGQ